ncbi:hypothetical protein BCR34DRAFT_596467 [Clohesyomyces aquaticus]|uniref:Uncharacterized protein n=1 Tax=Clohesyomyces aquaticus TaxID=1231657 RepID=A0A1Y2A881_9PLEO|nr:hypothetical protein BCR34DRAFT_596467 [Clohesyomyces aquaticus]
MQLNHPATFPTVETHTALGDQAAHTNAKANVNGNGNATKGPTIAVSPTIHSHPKQNNPSPNQLPLVHPKTAFIDFQPLHIVLEFPHPGAATAFHEACHSSVTKAMHPTWVYLPMPHGLKRAKRTDRGDIAFLFDSRQLAELWDRTLMGIGRLGASEDRDTNEESTEGMGIVARTMSLGHKSRDTSKTVFVGEVGKLG